MLQQDYIKIEKARLIDLPQLPAGLLIQWLSTKPIWMQKRVMKQLSLKH